jgi:crotonobetainyl-CoA:carnitine CoA-transferase CaiB-like acyl-CoA transferase
VERVDEVVASKHLEHRGFWIRAPHPEFGVRALPGPSWRASRSPMRATTAAPQLGQHTAEVLRDVLGLDEDVIASLDAAGVLS